LFYLNAKQVYIPPANIIISIDKLNYGILELEYNTGLIINDDETLNAICNCIIEENLAITEIEYYCLDIVSKFCNGNIYGELDSVLKFLIYYGNEIFHKIKTIGLYQNGIFPFVYKQRRYDSIHFMRKDILYDQIKRELIKNGQYSDLYNNKR
jgi:hypothetical protein